jgi:hypothetical protein
MHLSQLFCGYNPITDYSSLSRATLKELHCAGAGLKSLETLTGLRLVYLNCTENEIESLSPLEDMPLINLNCGDNKFVDIGALRGMPLRKLEFYRNNVTSLEPLGGMKIEYLSFWGNKVESLEPLRGMPLQRLDCNSNPLRSLEPFIHNPPPSFRFFCPDLPDTAIESAVSVWSSDRRYAKYLEEALILRAYKKNDIRKLRDLARSFGSSRYLFMPINLGWEQADSTARAMGGHLVTITSPEEQRFMEQFRNDIEPFWIGLQGWSPNLKWVTGEPADYVNGLNLSDRGVWWSYADTFLAAYIKVSFSRFVVEWDDNKQSPPGK